MPDLLASRAMIFRLRSGAGTVTTNAIGQGSGQPIALNNLWFCVWGEGFKAPSVGRSYLIACGLIGEPVPPVMTSGAPQKKNS
jgi:hypothetical protein